MAADLEDRSVEDLKDGVGEKIAKKIDEYLKCGIIKKLENV